jgi:CheY-like chemotaxis protein
MIAEEPMPVTASASAPVGLSILIVEDDLDSAHSMAMLLRAAGHQVQVTHDGESAIKAGCESHPDVALIDIGLPDMDGRSVAEQLRHKVDGRRPLLIAITGYDRDEQKSLSAGIDLHLTKPTDPQALLGMLRRFTQTLKHIST